MNADQQVPWADKVQQQAESIAAHYRTKLVAAEHKRDRTPMGADSVMRAMLDDHIAELRVQYGLALAAVDDAFRIYQTMVDLRERAEASIATRLVATRE